MKRSLKDSKWLSMNRNLSERGDLPKYSNNVLSRVEQQGICMQRVVQRNKDRPLTVLISRTSLSESRTMNPSDKLTDVLSRRHTMVDRRRQRSTSEERKKRHSVFFDEITENIHTDSKVVLESVIEEISCCSELNSEKNSMIKAGKNSEEHSKNIYACFTKISSNESLIVKLQSMVRALKMISQYWIHLMDESSSMGPCTDELLDILILLLCQWNQTSALYPHIMLLRDHIPVVFDGGHFAYALVQFTIAFDIIKERVVMKQNFGSI